MRMLDSLKLQSNFMKILAANAIARYMKNKLGIDISNLKIETLDLVTNENGVLDFSINASGSVKVSSIANLLKS